MARAALSAQPRSLPWDAPTSVDVPSSDPDLLSGDDQVRVGELVRVQLEDPGQAQREFLGNAAEGLPFGHNVELLLSSARAGLGSGFERRSLSCLGLRDGDSNRLDVCGVEADLDRAIDVMVGDRRLDASRERWLQGPQNAC